MAEEKKEERMVKVSIKDYRNYRNAMRRQEKARRLAQDLWNLFAKTK
jgi:hypothetical protein